MLATDVLPNELLLEIFSSCDTNSKAALCPVSKLFRQFVEPKMYEIVDIVGGDWRCPIVAFERALFAKPERAHWVRDLSIEAASYQNQSGGTPGAMILDVQKIDRILCKTTELHRLCLKIWHWKNISEFRSLKTGLFPQLRIFQPMTPNFYYIHNSQLAIITSFLNRHPGLSHLYLGGLVPEHSVRSSVYLPNLVVLEGPHSILEHAPKLCSLKLTVPVAWGTDVAFDLTRFSSISHLAFAVQGSIQNIEVAFELLKQQLPRVTFLAIMRQPPYYGSISVGLVSLQRNVVLISTRIWLQLFRDTFQISSIFNRSSYTVQVLSINSSAIL
ncbi:hypothetical protein C8J56DRAFT_465288 [Mycena floridula]|nr:hypothetical protein C8J56DRAFT_465288 [Mycena floridula]